MGVWMMWEDVTIALSCVGFLAAVVVILLELPALLRAAQDYARLHH
jgi:hypothetical protein